MLGGALVLPTWRFSVLRVLRLLVLVLLARGYVLFLGPATVTEIASIT